MNLYRYCGNGPASNTDPTGLQSPVGYYSVSENIYNPPSLIPLLTQPPPMTIAIPQTGQGVPNQMPVQLVKLDPNDSDMFLWMRGRDAISKRLRSLFSYNEAMNKKMSAAAAAANALSELAQALKAAGMENTALSGMLNCLKQQAWNEIREMIQEKRWIREQIEYMQKMMREHFPSA